MSTSDYFKKGAAKTTPSNTQDGAFDLEGTEVESAEHASQRSIQKIDSFQMLIILQLLISLNLDPRKNTTEALLREFIYSTHTMALKQKK